MKKWLWMALLLVPAGAWADESKLQLKDGPGRDVVTRSCVNCHSVDYIPLNSVFLDRNGWQGTVTKMINAFGAPIAKDDVPVIVDYLTKYYGR